MIVGGTSRARRFFNFSPITVPVGQVGAEVISLPSPNAQWAEPGPADIDLPQSGKTALQPFILVGGFPGTIGTMVFSNTRVQEWVREVLEWDEPVGPDGQPLAY